MRVSSLYTVTCVDRELVVGLRTLIMGIVNVTPDSFSDGGNFLSSDRAVEHAEFLVQCGADIIDIGGESTRPFANSVSVDEEIRRIIPVIETLSDRIFVPISVDTTKAEVAERAVAAGASIINDISALSFDSEMAKVAAQCGAGLILMHMRGTPKDMQLSLSYEDLIGEIKSFLFQAINRAVFAGLARSSIIIDPGLGFGKTVDHNLEIIKRLGEFSNFKVPIMIGSSRKSFIRKILTNRSNSDLKPASNLVETGTQATIAASVMSGANIVRVHNVADTRATLDVLDAIKNVFSGGRSLHAL